MKRSRCSPLSSLVLLLTSSTSTDAVARSTPAVYRHFSAPRDKRAIEQYPIANPSEGSTSTTLSKSSTEKTNRLPINAVSSLEDIDARTENLSVSPCYPENDGYFGGTYGTPLLLQIGFELQAYQEAEVESALTTINNLLIQQVLTYTFPSVCGDVTRRLEQTEQQPGAESYGSEGTKITGFKFQNQFQVDVSEPCETLSVSDKFKCSVYLGFISVYGRGLSKNSVESVLDIAKTSVNGVHSYVSAFGVVDVASVNKYFRTVEESQSDSDVRAETENENMNSIKNVSFVKKFGLAMSAVLFCTGLAILIMYVWLDIQHRRQKLKLARYAGIEQYDKSLSPVKEARIVGSKPIGHRETKIPSGFRRTRRATESGNTHVGDESQVSYSSLTTRSMGMGSSMPSQYTREMENAKKSVLLEFEPGFDPPLGRPESTEVEIGCDDGVTEYDEKDEDTVTCNSSIADLSNIDESILVTDRRRRLKRKNRFRNFRNCRIKS